MPGLDGVRGAAILLVFAYHVLRSIPYNTRGAEWLHRTANTGWIGVDLFFVLSGFLITGILLDTKSGPGYFRLFYGRRALRILPLYLTFVTVLLVALPALPLMSPAQAEALRQAKGWYWSHAVNVMIARHGWEHGTWHSGHLWSLSLEEQFYACWPAVVYVLSRRRLIGASVTLILGVWIFRAALVAAGVSWTAIYVLLPTRVDTLAMGALLAAVARERADWFRLRRWIAPAVGSALVLAYGFRHDALLRSSAFTQVLGYPALGLLGCAAVVHAVTAPVGSLGRHVWANSSLRFFGRYSYGLYVWHVPLIPVVRRYVFAPEQVGAIDGSIVPAYLLFSLVALTCSVILALVSWHLIEAPFLSLKTYLPYTRRETLPAADLNIAPIPTAP